jgi:hypothetical protein
MLHVDEGTAALVRRALLKCADKGTDPVRALDELGYLHYAEKMRETMAHTLMDAARMLDESTVQQVAGGRQRAPSSPLDMKRQVVDWLQRQAEAISVGPGPT